MSQSADKVDTLPTSFDLLQARLAAGEARACVVGLGTAGLPMLAAIASAGLTARGIDIDAELVEAVNRGEPANDDVERGLLTRLVRQGRLSATRDFSALADADCIVVSVPTSSTERGEPDVGPVLNVAGEIARHLRPGQLVIIESTVPPGTTRDAVLPLLATSGLKVGTDFFLVFSPERIDPGNTVYSIQNIPKVIGGITEACTALAASFYQRVVARVHTVSSPEVAETAKVFENTFRFVNISLANELSQLSEGLGISVTEVLDAAATKPFAFMRHTPGPGVGGRCLPMASHFFHWAAERRGVESRIVDAAIQVNDLMPRRVAEGALELANGSHAGGDRPSVLIVGMAYKPGVSDVRGSLALAIGSLLAEAGVDVRYHDPLVPRVSLNGEELTSVPLTPESVAAADCVLVVCPHSTIDFGVVRTHARRLMDPTRTVSGG